MSRRDFDETKTGICIVGRHPMLFHGRGSQRRLSGNCLPEVTGFQQTTTMVDGSSYTELTIHADKTYHSDAPDGISSFIRLSEENSSSARAEWDHCQNDVSGRSGIRQLLRSAGRQP